MSPKQKRSRSTDVREPGFAETHAELERAHNAAEHERRERGREYDSVKDEARDESAEPWPDYDLDVMPRGV
jgi:hypothetical protein